MKSTLFQIVLEAVWEATGDAMMVVDDRGDIVACNAQVQAFLGWTPDALLGQRIESLVPNGKRGDHRRHRAAYERDPTPRRMGNDIVLFAQRADGREVPVDISLSSVTHDGRLFTLAVVRDASRRHAYEEELRRLGFRDGLTGLYNRHYFDEELARLQRGRTWPVGILMADLDGLKGVNDEFGHEAGDLLIQRAARALSSAVRADDIVARLGGDEFAVLLPGLGGKELDAICARVEASCNEYAGAVPLRMSTGCSVAEDGESLRAVLREADARMYADKAGRRQAVSR